MRFFVGVTDYNWYKVHASRLQVDEVNFWRPSPDAGFKALKTGEPFLFKLHSPRNFIVGGGFFTKFLQLPVSLAWEAFGNGNGANTFLEVRQKIAKYRRQQVSPEEDPRIGCIILTEPFFFPESDWIPCPDNFSLNIVSGKGYDTDEPMGASLWADVSGRLVKTQASDPGPATVAAIHAARFGAPVLVMPRLGQGAFRLLITDAYEHRCAMTGERTRPALEAAHIKPYSRGGPHELSNGILLRSDLHKL
ncbi:MAG: restriction endonuclease, partial [Candidatus Sulfotelmatobacter sp.]|nr:restriction endonuclease [Candidatus Sulfotelmatobacter sp.]